MKTFCRTVCCIIFCLSLPIPVSSARVVGDELRDEVEFLCGERFRGRMNGDEGAVQTVCYVSQMFRSAGYETSLKSYGHDAFNVFGVKPGVPGCGYIVIMAYYDGLGLKDGEMYPGADANASGVAAMLELGRSLASGLETGRGLVLAAVGGHCDGLAGAEALPAQLEALGVRARDIRLVVNLDTIGSKLAPVMRAWKEYMIVLGGERYQTSLLKCNEGLGLRLYFDYYESRRFTDMFYRRMSDHRFLLEKGVPCLMFTSGITDNTNRTTDTPATLDYGIMKRRIQLIRRFITTF